MDNSATSQAFRATLECEITVIQEARDALPEDSHLRALCNLAAERLADLASPGRAVPAATPAEFGNVHPIKRAG
jgi:hypothetical protein